MTLTLAAVFAPLAFTTLSYLVSSALTKAANSSGVVVEPYLITLTTESDTFPAFQHEGLELLYMLEGEVDYRHGDQVYALKPGDTLFFDADAPHGPEVLVKLPARYLSVISYPQG